MERSSWTCVELCVCSQWSDRNAACRGQLRLFRQQRKVPASAARRGRLVSVRVKENSCAGGLRFVLRSTRQSELPPRPERSLQHRLRGQKHFVLRDRAGRDIFSCKGGP